MKFLKQWLLSLLLLILFVTISWSLMRIPGLIFPERAVFGIPCQALLFFGSCLWVSLLVILCRRRLTSWIPLLCRTTLGLTLLTVLLQDALPIAPAGLLFVVLLFLLAALILSVLSSYKTAGLESLCLLILSFFVAEACLQALPEQLLANAIKHTPPLARPDRSIQYYQDHAFKGKKACAACSIDTRIITTGGSSTYGVPLFYSSAAYPSQLDTLIQRRHPTQTFEVLNAGVAGHGITQIFYALEHTLLAVDPDIVTINCWFNDSSPGTGWYGLPGKSDREAFQYLYPLWKLQEHPWYQWIHKRRLYALFRLYLVEVKQIYQAMTQATEEHIAPTTRKKKKTAKAQLHTDKRRLSPEEYAQTLEEIIVRLQDANVVPVLLFEPLHHTHSDQAEGLAKQYFEVVSRLAKAYDLPFINPLPEFSRYEESIVFHDFIHPNADGHTLLAEALYRGLRSHPKTAPFFHQSADNVLLDTLITRQLPYNGEAILQLTLGIPNATEAVRLDIALDDQILVEQLPVNPGTQRIDIPVPALPLLPQYKLSIRSHSPDHVAGHFPGTDIVLPAQIRLLSGGKPFGWHAAILVNNEAVHIDSRGYTLVVLDANSGGLLTRRAFDTPGSAGEADALLQFLEDLTQKYPNAILALAVRTDGHAHVDRARLSSLLQSFGGSGITPESLESFAFIGKQGLPSGTAFEATGPRFIDLSSAPTRGLQRALIQLKDAAFVKALK